MFGNLTDEQVETIEKMIKDAYEEGWRDNGKDDDMDEEWEMSLAKNESCCIVAEKFIGVE